MRLDTADDVNRAIARYMELVKLAALIQRPGTEPEARALAALNELLGRVATPGAARRARAASALDEYVRDEGRARGRAQRGLAEARREPSLDPFIPRRGDGLALSASDIDLYRICPLKYKFARVFAIPQEPTINQRFGILVHQVLERFHSEEIRAAAPHRSGGERPPGSLDRLLELFEGGWRRSGFGVSDDELQYRDRAVAALARYHERHQRSETSRPVWLERRFSFSIGSHQLRGRVDRVDRLPDGGYELIDYKTGERKAAAELADDAAARPVPLARPRGLGASRPSAAATGTCSTTSGSRSPAEPDDAERVERTVLEVAGGIDEPGLRAAPLLRDLQLVRLPADLPGVRGLRAGVRRVAPDPVVEQVPVAEPLVDRQPHR